MTDVRANISGTAMVLAAGFGQRMRPLTLEKPKPLLEVGGRTMLDRALDHVREAGLYRAVVNAHYLADQIAEQMASRKDMEIILSREETILETGGGVKKALPYFDGNPFFVMAADLPWTNGREPALLRLARAWDPARMDALLLVAKSEGAKGFPEGKGDFRLEVDGRLTRADAQGGKPFVFLSVMILSPALYEGIEAEAFSNNIVFDKAEACGRLYGLVHDGDFYHVGTPDDLAAANGRWQSSGGWA